MFERKIRGADPAQEFQFHTYTLEFTHADWYFSSKQDKADLNLCIWML